MLHVKGYSEEIRLLRNISQFDSVTPKANTDDFNDPVSLTEKWNPITFALYSGNFELVKYLLKLSLSNAKKLLKVPGLYNTQEMSRLFPFAISL